LLKTKVKVQFERPVKRLSKPFFSVFHRFNPGQFQPSFSVFTVRSAEGRKLIEGLANCQLLIANCSVFKDLLLLTP
jgi:hypothetical protein